MSTLVHVVENYACRGQKVSSRTGLKGIIKKLGLPLLVVVGVIVDVVLAFGADTLGWNLPFSYLVSCIVCLWLLANELISILENIADTGVAIPPFLKSIVEWVKKKSAPEIDATNSDTER